MMTRQAIGGLLDRMDQAWAWSAPDAHARELWYEILPDLDVDTGEAAAQRCIVGLDRYPTIHQFLDIAAEVEREMADAVRPGPDVPSPGPLPAGVRDTAKAFVGALKTALGAADRARRNGDDPAEAALRAFKTAKPESVPEDLRTYRCVCSGGFTEDDDGALRPCDRCNPVAAARWAGGHYELGHSCPECSARS